MFTDLTMKTLAVTLLALSACDPKEQPASPRAVPVPVAAPEPVPVVAPEPAAQAAPAEAPALPDEDTPAEEPVGWEYGEFPDEMTNKLGFTAAISSLEEHELDFPYNGGTSARLILRSHPRMGLDVMLRVSKGQLQCGAFSGCRILVKFDDAAPAKYRADGPADHSNDVLFLAPPGKIINAIRGAKQVKVEVPFFQNGTKLFTFKTEGLKWEAR